MSLPQSVRSIVLFMTAATAALAAAPAAPRYNFDESKVPAYTLPDPLRCEDGTPVRDANTWRTRRRAELLELFSRDVYGRTPAGRPRDMHWKTTSIDRTALGGKATRKEVTVWFTAGDNGPKMHLLIYQPNNRGAPWPLFLGLNYFGNNCVNADPGITLSSAGMRTSADQHIVNNRATEQTRGAHASRWQIETVIARGYATATVYYGDLCPDRDDGMHVASAEQDRGADPRGEFLSARHAGPVYALFGKKGLGADEPPAVDHPVGETVRYHMRTGIHDITAYDWAQYLDFADRHLRRR